MSGGTLSADQPIRRQRRHGHVFAHSGGTNNLATAVLYLGYNAADSGTYSFSGTARSSGSNQYVGYSGTGTVTQSGGANSASSALSRLQLRQQRNVHPQRRHADRAVEYVGYSGTGTFTQSGGTNTTRAPSTWATTPAATARTT